MVSPETFNVKNGTSLLTHEQILKYWKREQLCQPKSVRTKNPK